MGRAWVLNLDADLELGAKGPYAPSKTLRAAMAPHVERAAASLMGQEDRIVDDASAPGCALGMPGRAFCPTPRAIRLLELAGAQVEPHPPEAALRRVNGRAFASSLGQTLPGAAFVTDDEVARAMLQDPPPVGDAWRIKHAFGLAGRNQRVVVPASRDPHDLAFLVRALEGHGAQIEPDVVIVAEYAMHGVLGSDGSLQRGALVHQRCDARGAWLATERVVDPASLPIEISLRVADEAVRVGHALYAAGYFGPFGIDAYTYRDKHGALCLQPRSEINARYSMGFAVGFGRP